MKQVVKNDDFIDTRNVEWNYQLMFGKTLYSVEPSYRLELHFEEKIQIILKTIKEKDFFFVKEWDAKYKFQEWEKFKQYIKYKLLAETLSIH